MNCTEPKIKCEMKSNRMINIRPENNAIRFNCFSPICTKLKSSFSMESEEKTNYEAADEEQEEVELDAQDIRRRRNRESMRRVRLRKRLETQELKNLLPELENQLKYLRALQASQQLSLADPNNEVTHRLAQLHEETAQLEDDKRLLRQRIHKHEKLESSLQSLVDHYEATHANYMNQLETVSRHDLSQDPFSWVDRLRPHLPQFEYSPKEVMDFCLKSYNTIQSKLEMEHDNLQSVSCNILGWNTMRLARDEWYYGLFEKDLPFGNMEHISYKTWVLQTTSVLYAKGLALKVLQTITDNVFLCARNLYFPGDPLNYCSIYFVFRSQQSDGKEIFGYCPLVPTDETALQEMRCGSFSYVDQTYGLALTPYKDNQLGCHAQFMSLASNGTAKYAQTWAMTNIMPILNWENTCVSARFNLTA